VLCQPLEDKILTISRAQGLQILKANFQWVAALNPCKPLVGLSSFEPNYLNPKNQQSIMGVVGRLLYSCKISTNNRSEKN